MAEHTATVSWQRFDAAFTDNRYSRAHRWMFDGGATIPASSSPHVVPVPLSDPMGVDPEEAFVASLSSCHMLTFLAIAAKKKLVVDSYEDDAVGILAKNADGRLAITQVTLRPRVTFSGTQPDDATLEQIHHVAHEQCFIANSVNCEMHVDPQEVHA